jgi:hypothetical protein
MAKPRDPLFLERETYRQRRRMDAARFLPFLGAALFVAPALWGGVPGTLAGLIYLIGVWIVLIALAALLARGLRSRDPDAGGEQP